MDTWPAAPVFTQPVRIAWEVYYPVTSKIKGEKRQPAFDWDNIVAALKPWQDMMVKMGWLKNDSSHYIAQGTVHVFHQSKQGPAMRLVIEELEG